MVNSKVDYNTKVLEVRDLKKHFKVGTGRNKLVVPAVDGLSFDIYKREVFGLVGESGCGKTTTGRTIIKLYNSTEGDVKLNDTLISSGYMGIVAKIKEVKAAAQEEILKVDQSKALKDKINDKYARLISDVEMNIAAENESFEETEKTIKEPLATHQEEKYLAKYNYDLAVEAIKHQYNLDLAVIKDSAVNSAQADYDREKKGFEIGLKRKIDGMKDSAALNVDYIDARIADLKAEYEIIFADLEEKYKPLIAEAEANIAPKAEAQERTKALKAERKEKLAAAKAEFKKNDASIVVPNKAKINAEFKTAKAEHDAKISTFKSELTDLKKQKSDELSKVPSNKELGVDQNDVNAQVNEIKHNRDEKVKELRQAIKRAKEINASREALEYSRKMQMIFQDPISSLNPRMTVLEIVGEGLLIQGGLSREEIKERVQDMLEIVGLQKDYVTRYPHEFSGGQRQRLGIARALIMNPDFIIADEPISALDVSIRAQVINLLQELKDRLGLTIMFVAHDLSVVRFFCDRIAVMYNGKIVELAESEELFANPMHPYTRSLLSSVPQPDPDYEKNRTKIGYDPRQHDYRFEKPTLKEVAPGHSVLCNDVEFEEIKNMYNANGTNKAEEGVK